MRNNLRSGLLSAFLILFSMLKCQALVAGWVDATISGGNGRLLKAPQANGTLLGQYPTGTRIKVFTPAKNGYFAIYFAKPWKGVNYAWVPATDLSLGSGGFAIARNGRNRTLSSDYTGPSKNWIRAGALGSLFSPSDYTTALSYPSSSFFGLAFEVSYSRFLFNFLYGTVRLSSFGFNQTVTSGTYFANGYMVTIGGEYPIIKTPIYMLLAGLGFGMSLDSAGNSNQTNQITSSFIFGFPIYLDVTNTLKFARHWAAYLRLGYQIHSLSSIPSLVPPSGQVQVAVPPNMGLSSPFVSLGASFEF